MNVHSIQTTSSFNNSKNSRHIDMESSPDVPENEVVQYLVDKLNENSIQSVNKDVSISKSEFNPEESVFNRPTENQSHMIKIHDSINEK